MASPDKSNGYDAIVPLYIAARGQNASAIGASVVAHWSKSLPPKACILDLGCGTGVPITKTLLNHGFSVYGVDASPRMIAAFQAHFPTTPVQCAAVEDSDFFSRTFDAIVAWGLLFLLNAEAQRKLIGKIAAALAPGGNIVFTAPKQACTWTDAMTNRPSFSLGHEAYRNTLAAERLQLVGTETDAGENDYYFARKL